jgi:hypothetical protein
MKWCILLTACVLRNFSLSKFNYYREAIEAWLTKTDLPIFIVESSGYKFSEFSGTRLKVYTFNLSEKLASSSQYEARSIIAALEYFKEDMKPYTHILKVTARYYVEDMRSILYNSPPTKILVQHLQNTPLKWNNSEIFGIRKRCLKPLMKTIINLGYMEQAIYNFKETHTHRILPPMKNVFGARRGGDDFIVDPL